MDSNQLMASFFMLAMSESAQRKTWPFIIIGPLTLLAMIGVVLGVVLTVLLPALATCDAAMPAMAGVVLTLVALLVVGSLSPSGARQADRGSNPIGDAPPLVLSGRVTDPVHHPLRPRAPGPA